MSKAEFEIVGLGEDGETPVVSGAYILALKDREGLSMAAINTILAKHGHSFDVWGFLLACKENPNFDRERALRLLKEDSDKALWPAFEVLSYRAYLGMGPLEEPPEEG